MNNKLKFFIYRKSELLKQNKTQINNFLTNQNDGNKKLKVIYNHKEYIFEETMDENYYVLYKVIKI